MTVIVTTSGRPSRDGSCAFFGTAPDLIFSAMLRSSGLRRDESEDVLATAYGSGEGILRRDAGNCSLICLSADEQGV